MPPEAARSSPAGFKDLGGSLGEVLTPNPLIRPKGLCAAHSTHDPGYEILKPRVLRTGDEGHFRRCTFVVASSAAQRDGLSRNVYTPLKHRSPRQVGTNQLGTKFCWHGTAGPGHGLSAISEVF